MKKAYPPRSRAHFGSQTSKPVPGNARHGASSKEGYDPQAPKKRFASSSAEPQGRSKSGYAKAGFAKTGFAKRGSATTGSAETGSGETGYGGTRQGEKSNGEKSNGGKSNSGKRHGGKRYGERRHREDRREAKGQAQPREGAPNERRHGEKSQRDRGRPSTGRGHRERPPKKYYTAPAASRDELAVAGVTPQAAPPKKYYAPRRQDRRGPQPDKARSTAPAKHPHATPERLTSNKDTLLIWGLHAARAAWLNPQRKCYRLWLTEAGQKAFAEAIVAARDELLLKRPDAKNADRAELDRLTPPNSVHQGIVLEVGPLPEPSLAELITGDNPPDCLVMLDQVTDPHNIGAILRSAAAFGAGAVILTERNAPGLTGVLAKSASGAADHVPQIHVVNLARTLDELRQAGYWCVGLAEEGEKLLGACDLSGRSVIVLGAEGDGLRQLTRKKCDELAKLPTGGPVGSLNVSNAAAVALYEARRQKK
ncbi:MAG: 23S rRNA (guanosine(2251)-2'-O)-methyltransferase RlmB [Pseudomonadota bacterium]|nr:23S rRNA (guanosine(2251)-2'-O)-methyltransferase RlmB [Pseudomonadota bacterium]